MSELTRIETVVFLQKVDLFSACTAEQILRISGIVNHRSFESREKIYQANDPSECMYCIVDGTVEVSGADSPAMTLSSPESFGVKEILSGRLREQDAVALEALRVLTIDADDLFDLLANNIEIVKALFRRLLDSTDSRMGGL
ncbi:MAG: cyclic nucleotide-binding domain-containing protein [bacterium]|nr:cyclic nucleotide-binding domain-containing protein [bacterium]